MTDPVFIRFLRDFHEEFIKAHQRQLLEVQSMCKHPSANKGECPDCGRKPNE